MRSKALASVALLALIATSLTTGCTRLEQAFTPPPKIVTEEATRAAVGAPVQGKLAAGLPDSMPLWPGATVLRSGTEKTPQGANYTAEMVTLDPYSDVSNAMGAALEEQGWQVAATDIGTPELPAEQLVVEKGDEQGIVSISQTEDGKVKIEIIMTQVGGK